jgi:hypothetical protein
MKDDAPMRVLTDDEFLAAVADEHNPEEFNLACLELRRQGKIQIFDDGSGDPLLVVIEQTN